MRKALLGAFSMLRYLREGSFEAIPLSNTHLFVEGVLGGTEAALELGLVGVELAAGVAHEEGVPVARHPPAVQYSTVQYSTVQ